MLGDSLYIVLHHTIIEYIILYIKSFKSLGSESELLQNNQNALGLKL